MNNVFPGECSRSAIDPDRIRLFAETVGITGTGGEDKVTSQAYTVLADELTDLIKKIVIDANKYAIHARRSCLCLDDIERACRDRNIQPPLSYVSPETRELRHIPNPTGEDFFVREDPEYDLAGLLAQPAPKLPQQMHLRVHWLVYEGVVQPVPENILPPKEEVADVTEDEDLGSGVAGAIQARRDTAKQPQQSSASAAFRQLARSAVAKEAVAVRPIPAATLSMEKQAFLKSVIETCVGNNDKIRLPALHALETDTGLQAALPIIAQIVMNGVRANVVQRCLSLLIYLVRVARSLALNRSLNLEPVLHHLIPALLTCTIGRNLCGRPESDNHWALRDFASKTLVMVVKGHTKNTPTTKSRVVRCLRRVFEDSDATFAMIYGTVFPLHDLINDKEYAELSPRYFELLEMTQSIATSQPDPNQRDSHLRKTEAEKLLQALQKLEKPMREHYPGTKTVVGGVGQGQIAPSSQHSHTFPRLSSASSTGVGGHQFGGVRFG